MFQKQHEMAELGLINYGDRTYYLQHQEEYEKDSKICELESEIERLEYLLRISDKAKIDYAVEQLERVKEEMTYNGNGYCEVRQCSSPHTPNLNFAWFNYVVFNKFIDNQINQLKEGK